MTTLNQRLQSWLDGSVPPPPIAQLLGMILEECSQGTSRVRMQVGLSHHSPMGTVHGGVLCDLADAAMGTALASLMKEEESFTTVELAAHFFTPVRECP